MGESWLFLTNWTMWPSSWETKAAIVKFLGAPFGVDRISRATRFRPRTMVPNEFGITLLRILLGPIDLGIQYPFQRAVVVVEMLGRDVEAALDPQQVDHDQIVDRFIPGRWEVLALDDCVISPDAAAMLAFEVLLDQASASVPLVKQVSVLNARLHRDLGRIRLLPHDGVMAPTVKATILKPTIVRPLPIHIFLPLPLCAPRDVSPTLGSLRSTTRRS